MRRREEGKEEDVIVLLADKTTSIAPPVHQPHITSLAGVHFAWEDGSSGGVILAMEAF